MMRTEGSTTEEGSVTAWLMVVPLLVMVLGGISLDLWAAVSARGRIAAIADEAAVAGASALSEDGSRQDLPVILLEPEEAVRRALLAVDGHPENADVVTRTASATADLVSVTVEGQFDFLLLRLVGAESAPVRVTGHAAPVALD